MCLATAGCKPAPPSEEPHPAWHYEGHEGPEHWGTIDAKFAPCASGREQSPIDIAAPASRDSAEAVAMTFPPASLRILHQEHVADAINNGHTIQVNYSQGDTLTVGDSAYQLAQYHFHAPSEHSVDGRHFPMEMHMVHTSARWTPGCDRRAHCRRRSQPRVRPDLDEPAGEDRHRAPPRTHQGRCRFAPARGTHNVPLRRLADHAAVQRRVKWFVMTNPIALSRAQIAAFTVLFPHNTRPVQPLNGRFVHAEKVGG